MYVCSLQISPVLLPGGAGMYLAKRMKVTELPQMVAAFHALVGLAATTTSVSNYMMMDHMDDVHKTAAFFGAFIGAVTLTGVK